MQNIMLDTRLNMNETEKGVITVMLRDAAMLASQEPTQLNSFELNVLGNNEASVQIKLK